MADSGYPAVPGGAAQIESERRMIVRAMGETCPVDFMQVLNCSSFELGVGIAILLMGEVRSWWRINARIGECDDIRDNVLRFRIEKNCCSEESYRELLNRTCWQLVLMLPRFYGVRVDCRMRFTHNLLDIIQGYRERLAEDKKMLDFKT